MAGRTDLPVLFKQDNTGATLCQGIRRHAARRSSTNHDCIYLRHSVSHRLPTLKCKVFVRSNVLYDLCAIPKIVLILLNCQ